VSQAFAGGAVSSSTSGSSRKPDGRSPAGTVASYDPGKLLPLKRQMSARAEWPAWRKGASPWQWIHIPGTDLSSVVPQPPVPGSPRSRINAWNGLAADIHTNRLFSAANGGHADYSGNGVYEIDLSADSPRWKMLRAPTPEAEIVASNGSKGIFYDYYLDGRPSSTHTYYALQFLASRNAIFKFGAGSLWGTGNEANWKIDGFSLSDKDWHPPGTWPEVTPGSRKAVTASSICMDPVTEVVYVAAPDALRSFEPASGEVTKLARWVENSTAVRARACAVDPVRGKIVYFGDGYRAPTGGLVYDMRSKKLTRMRFSGELASQITSRKHHFAWYDPALDRFLLKTNVRDKLYAIHPETYAVEQVKTKGGDSLPNAVNGVHTRWQRLPGLGGYAYYPRSGSGPETGVWFLATE
jgi:hypothetical protein